MSETDSTTTDTVKADLPVALHALTGHMLTHRLPSHDISYPHPGNPHITVWIRKANLPAWEAADFTVASRTEHPLRHDPSLGRQAWARTVIDGHIPTPIGDLALQLVYVAPATAPLLSVVS